MKWRPKSPSTFGRFDGVRDVHLHQVMNVPKLHVDVDQTRARELGLTQQDVANSLLVSLSGSGQVQPNYWVDPKMGISYLVETRTPTYKLDSIDSINSLPLISQQSQGVQLLSNVAKVGRSVTPEVANHTNVQPTFDVYANVEGATWEASPARSISCSTGTEPSSPRATPSPCAARSRAWSRPSSGWGWV